HDPHTGSHAGLDVLPSEGQAVAVQWRHALPRRPRQHVVRKCELRADHRVDRPATVHAPGRSARAPRPRPRHHHRHGASAPRRVDRKRLLVQPRGADATDNTSVRTSTSGSKEASSPTRGVWIERGFSSNPACGTERRRRPVPHDRRGAGYASPFDLKNAAATSFGSSFWSCTWRARVLYSWTVSAALTLSMIELISAVSTLLRITATGLSAGWRPLSSCR